MKRRLPIIQSQSGGRESEERSPLAWRAIGATLAFSLWLPLSMLGSALGRALVSTRVDASDPVQLAHYTNTASGSAKLLLTLALSGPAMLAFVIACGLSGALVGRFGTTARPRDAGMGGAAAAAVGCLVAALGGAFGSLAVAILVFGVLAIAGYASAAFAAQTISKARGSGSGVDPDGAAH